jgi:lysozyme family protein
MAMFELAIPIVLRHEGGYVNAEGDPGGATNFGISLRWLKEQGLAGDINHDGDVDINDIKAMTVDDAKAIYRTYWWDKYGYGNILAQAVANKVFDMAVNLGAPRAHKMVQQALDLPQDGILGPESLNGLNTQPSLQLILSLQNIQAQFYRDLVASNPARQKFLNGWLNRAYDRC